MYILNDEMLGITHFIAFLTCLTCTFKLYQRNSISFKHTFFFHTGPGRISNYHAKFAWDVPLEENMFYSDGKLIFILVSIFSDWFHFSTILL